MDLQSYCVENRRKVHSFAMLRSSLQSSQKMSQSFSFGMPVNGDIGEEQCFHNIQNMSCDAELSFQNVNKNSEYPPKKNCFDHFNKFSSLSFSKVVGGFVGSKSQGGSASREPHQVWDVILRQLVDTACQAPLNNNLHQYFNIGNTVSQSIFGQFSGVGHSTLDFASYIISRPSDFFGSKRTTMSNCASDNSCKNSNIHVSMNKNFQSSQIPSEVNQENVKNERKLSDFISQKQSYADVAKSHITSRLEPSSLSEMPKRVHNPSMDKRPMRCHRYSRKLHVGESRSERRNGIHHEHSQNLSSQHQQQKKHSIPLDKFDDHQIPSKFVRDRFEYNRHNRQASSNVHKYKTRDSISQQPCFLPQVCEEKKTRNSKFRNYNMRDKERKNIDFQVHEDIANVCHMSESECQNWRCEHNRIPCIQRNRAEFLTPRQNCSAKKFRISTRFHSPPPRTLDINSDKSKLQKMKIDCPKKRNEINSLKTSEEMTKTCEKLDSSIVLTSDESTVPLASHPSIILDALPERAHLISECSVDSEDSCIVFERDELDSPDDYSEDDCESDTNSVSDVASVEDCDEVDFQYYSPSQVSMCIMPADRGTDAFSQIVDRLKDINKRWREENSSLSPDEKIPKKVHFANDEDLTKVYQMVHWGFAYREARRGPWEEIGRDRCRFQTRISNAERELVCVLDPKHRRKVWEERMCTVALT